MPGPTQLPRPADPDLPQTSKDQARLQIRAFQPGAAGRFHPSGSPAWAVSQLQSRPARSSSGPGYAGLSLAVA